MASRRGGNNYKRTLWRTGMQRTLFLKMKRLFRSKIISNFENMEKIRFKSQNNCIWQINYHKLLLNVRFDFFSQKIK